MFIIRVVILTLLFFMVFNFQQIRSGRFTFDRGAFLLPFSLSFALVLVDTFLRAAFFYAIVIFIIVATLCYLLLRFLEKGG